MFNDPHHPLGRGIPELHPLRVVPVRLPDLPGIPERDRLAARAGGAGPQRTGGRTGTQPQPGRQMYACFACMACNEVCPVGIRPADLAVDMRQLQEEIRPTRWKQTLFGGLVPKPRRHGTGHPAAAAVRSPGVAPAGVCPGTAPPAARPAARPGSHAAAPAPASRCDRSCPEVSRRARVRGASQLASSWAAPRA